MSKTTTSLIVGITFLGAASACVVVTSSYPIAIWAVGFAAIIKVKQGKQPKHTCPLYEMAVAREVMPDVDVPDIQRVGEDKSLRRVGAK